MIVLELKASCFCLKVLKGSKAQKEKNLPTCSQLFFFYFVCFMFVAFTFTGLGSQYSPSSFYSWPEKKMLWHFLHSPLSNMKAPGLFNKLICWQSGRISTGCVCLRVSPSCGLKQESVVPDSGSLQQHGSALKRSIHTFKNDWHTIKCALNPQGWMYLALSSVVFFFLCLLKPNTLQTDVEQFERVVEVD